MFASRKTPSALIAAAYVFSILFSTLPVPGLAPVVSAMAPTCNGLTATIYVDMGFIVGGPDNGLAYAGTLNGTAAGDVMVGTSGDDIIVAGNGANTICGLGGADTITSGINNDWVDAGEGNNDVDTSGGSDTITTGDGDDTITSSGGVNTIDAGNGNNTVTGGSSTDNITTGTGNDTINAGNGNNDIDDAGGDNTVTTGINNDTVDILGSGTNTVNTSGGSDTINTGDGDDTITTTSGINIINAGNGDNVITGGASTDTITTGSGDDQITGGNGNNVINAGAGDDIVTTGINNDTIDGEDGNDSCVGGGGTDTISNCEETTHGTVVIVKDTNPDDAQDFDFTLDTSGFTTSRSFTLDDDADGTLSNTRSFPKPVGTYVATELAVAGWDITSVNCVDPDGGTTTGSSLATIDLDDGETVTCTFVNEPDLIDFGDAPDPTYPTLLASDGARHKLSAVYLGASIDDESDGQPTAGVDGDDTDGNDDEDGVTFGMWMAGEMGTGSVTATSAGYLDAWADFNNDGDWDDMYEHIVDDQAMVAGSNSIIFAVPSGSYVGNVVTRFRFASTTIATYTGEEDDGEVEDYLVPVAAPIAPFCEGEEATIYVDGNNKVVGGPLNGTVFAGTLTGTAGDDVIVGTSGDDTITGEAGDDRICGREGDDDIRGNGGKDKIWGEEGEDTLRGNGNDDTLRGGPDDDTILGGNGDDKLRGNGGADTIEGGNGDDNIKGGGGADEIYGDDGEDTIEGGNGDDTIEGGDDDDYIEGNDGEDEIRGQQGADEIYGGAGPDDIFGGAGPDELYGDDGDDSINGGPQPDTIYGGAGEDEIHGEQGPDEIYGGKGDDFIEGGAGDDEIEGEEGDDEIYGGPQDDMIRGGDGEDEIYGGFDDDFLCGDNDDDYIEGGGGRDNICGGTGDDELRGGADPDKIDGNDGTDIIDGGAEDDVCVNGEAVTTCEDLFSPVPQCSDKAACTPDDALLVGYWRLDGSSGATVATDSSSKGNDGTHFGPVQSIDVPTLGYGNMYSREFDGVDDYVSIPHDSTLAFDTDHEFSILTWVNPDSFGSSQIVAHKIDDTGAAKTGYMLLLDSVGNPEVWLISALAGGNFIRVEASGLFLPTGTWTQLGFSYDASGTAAGVQIFVDGVAVATNVKTDGLVGSIANTEDFEIGARSTNNSGYFNGKIDDVRVFKRALTQTQVNELYNGACEDNGAVSTLLTTTGGANGFRYRQNQLIKKLNNFGNSNFVNSPTPPAGFGGPEYFGGGSELLDWDQLSAVCIVHDEYLNELLTFDIIELMAENFSHMFGVSEEFILDIIENGTYCDPFYSARAEDERIEQELIAAEKQRKHEELMALYHMYKPEVMEFAVGEDGYPVSSDMIWNACIRNFEVFIEGQTKPLNCRRYHDGNMWEHPDTFVTFSWSNRDFTGQSIAVRGYQVATYTVPTPEFNAVQVANVQGKRVAQRTLSIADYIANKGIAIARRILEGDKQSVAVIFEEGSVLSEQTATNSQ